MLFWNCMPNLFWVQGDMYVHAHNNPYMLSAETQLPSSYYFSCVAIDVQAELQGRAGGAFAGQEVLYTILAWGNMFGECICVINFQLSWECPGDRVCRSVLVPGN